MYLNSNIYLILKLSRYLSEEELNKFIILLNMRESFDVIERISANNELIKFIKIIKNKYMI